MPGLTRHKPPVVHMPVVSFFKAEKSLTIKEMAAISGATYHGSDSHLSYASVSSVHAAQKGDVTFAAGPKQRDDLARLDGVLVFCTSSLGKFVPASCVTLECANPAVAFNRVARAIYPHALRSPDFDGCMLGENGTFVHASARLEKGVILSPGCVIGAHVEIGRGTRIGPGVTIAAMSTIGRDCDLGAHVTIQCSHIGDRVVVGPGTTIGHDGFGFVQSSGSFEKVPQLGRVIIQNNVEIGANTCIDRGSLNDTIIGEGTKIDNLVQVAHNVRIGRHCVIAGQAGIAGSATIGDYVMLGGACSIAEHTIIGDGALIAGLSGVMGEVPSGARYGGAPALPIKEWFRSIAVLRNLSAKTPKPDRDQL